MRKEIAALSDTSGIAKIKSEIAALNKELQPVDLSKYTNLESTLNAAKNRGIQYKIDIQGWEELNRAYELMNLIQSKDGSFTQLTNSQQVALVEELDQVLGDIRGKLQDVSSGRTADRSIASIDSAINKLTRDVQSFGKEYQKIWLNAIDEQWYKPQHEYDAPPILDNVTAYNAWNDYPGFCTMINHSFANMTLDTDIVCAWTIQQSGSESETITRKFFMPSAHELGITSSSYLPSISEGSQLSYFNSNDTRKIKPTQECVDNNDPSNTRIQLDTSCGYIIRTPYSNPSYSMTALITNNGELTNSYPNITYYSFRVCCNIPSSTPISDNPDADGYYTLQLKETSIKRTIPWSKTKDFYARQFTYNSKKQYQTILEGALASVIVEGAPAYLLKPFGLSPAYMLWGQL